MSSDAVNDTRGCDSDGAGLITVRDVDVVPESGDSSCIVVRCSCVVTGAGTCGSVTAGVGCEVVSGSFAEVVITRASVVETSGGSAARVDDAFTASVDGNASLVVAAVGDDVVVKPMEVESGVVDDERLNVVDIDVVGSGTGGDELLIWAPVDDDVVGSGVDHDEILVGATAVVDDDVVAS